MRPGPLLLLGIASISTAEHPADPSPVDWVNTFIGTGGSGNGPEYGGTMPLEGRPNPSYTNIMIGTHAYSLIAEATAKGFKGFDYALAYRAVYKDANTPPGLPVKPLPGSVVYEARAGLTYAKKLGYIPADVVSESASSTLEDTYDDYAVAQVAKAVGKTDDYRTFMQRSRSYKNLFNPARGFMQARNSDGSWASPTHAPL